MEADKQKTDVTQRRITKIAREAQQFTAKVLHDTGLGPSEYEFIHCVRHNPGISQSGIGETLNLDKAAVARRARNLEKKGYIERRTDPQDGRGKQLFATEKAASVKNAKVEAETFFYKWLLEELTGAEQQEFAKLLDRLYLRSKQERRAQFCHLLELEKQAVEGENRKPYPAQE